MRWSTTVLYLLLAQLAATVTALVTDNDRPAARIIDGEAVPISAAPFMASLRSHANVHFCGGAVVSSRYILTAAQCTNGRAANSIDVVVGTSLRNTDGTTHRSSSIINHPFFDGATLENDIALILTATVILITDHVQTAGFFPNFTTDYITDAKMFGWGIVAKDHGYDPMHLRTKVTETISNEDCRLELEDSENSWRVNENKLCTAVDQQSICYGDEGGVLVTNRLEIIGIASWHSYCSGKVPDVYERIEPHRLWIMSYIG